MSIDPRTTEWIANHVPSLFGWASLVYTCSKFVGFLVRVGRTAKEVENRVLDGEKTLHLIATNHLVHVQEAIEMTNAKADRTNELLEQLVKARHAK